MGNSTLKFLRKEVNKNKIEDGTVVRFTRTITRHYDEMRRETVPIPAGEQIFTYAAIYAGDRWNFTGSGQLGREKLKTRDFLDRLSESDISDIQMATEFEDISDDWD